MGTVLDGINVLHSEGLVPVIFEIVIGQMAASPAKPFTL
ncbi:unnamed protein product, partial [Rotaria sp. Silwood2]